MARAKTAPKSALRSRGKPNLTGKKEILGAQNIARIERRYQVYCMRRDGYTLKQIADILEIDERTASADLREILKLTISEFTESPEETRAVITGRLDDITRTFMPLTRERTMEVDDPKNPGQKKTVIITPSMNAADLILRVDAQRRKMLALDVPETKKLEVSGIREYTGIDLDKV